MYVNEDGMEGQSNIHGHSAGIQMLNESQGTPVSDA